MIAIIVIKRKPVLIVRIALKIKMRTVIQREYRGANIKLIIQKVKIKNTAVHANGTQSLREYVVVAKANLEPIFGT